MTPEKLRYAQTLMTNQTRSIADVCRELGGIPASTLYHYLHANGTLKEPGKRLPGCSMIRARWYNHAIVYDTRKALVMRVSRSGG